MSDERRRERRRRTSGPVGGHPAARVEQHAQRLALDRRRVDVAHRERRAIGERGARADHDGLRVGAQLVRVGAGRLAGDPLRRAVGRRDAAVEALAVLSEAERAAGAAVVQVRRERSRAPRSAPTPTSTSTPAARSRAKPRPRDLRVGILDRDDDAGDAGVDAARRRTAACGRGARTARASRTRSRRGPGRRRRAAPRPRRGPAGRLGGTLADDHAVADEHAADPGVRRRAAADRARRAATRSGHQLPSSPLGVAHVGPRVGRDATRGHGTRAARRRRARRRPLPSGLSPSAPASHRINPTAGCRGLAGSRSARGPSIPPVGTCTQPRGLTQLSLRSAIPRPDRKWNTF